jgi:hypothetical protein
VASKTHARNKLERRCRCISRPAVSEQQLAITPNGNLRYQLKTPYKDGTIHMLVEQREFIACLAVLGPDRESTLLVSTAGSPPTASTARWSPRPGGATGNKAKLSDDPLRETAGNSLRISSTVTRPVSRLEGCSRGGSGGRLRKGGAETGWRPGTWPIYYSS